ncbi:bifunctional DNA primase/helicase [Enterobacter ludwigii]|uniref:bifunctional DNA primase/helicase n=1 Tax=Enterobacter ludwigii TaxID=299767 RepID=UPI003BEF109D
MSHCIERHCIEKIEHTPMHGKCKSTTGQSLQVWLNVEPDGRKHFSGFCFPCGEFVKDPYGDNPPDPKSVKVKSPEEIQEEINEIMSCPRIDFEHRSIEPEWWQYYGVRLLYSEYDGKTPNAIAHPYTRDGKVVRLKIKLLNKKQPMWSVGDTQNNDPYGWERAKLAGGSTLYITEGEEDTIALTQILKTMNQGTKYEELNFAVISLTDGIETVQKTLGPKIDEINQRWDKVVIVFDNDEPGKRAAREACKLFPNAHVAILPANDANECLKRGLLKQTQEAVIWRAAKPLPSGILRVSTLKQRIKEPPKPGLSWPWSALTDMTYGQRKKEMIGIGGAVGGGKTTIAYELIAHNAKEHGWKTYAALMEGQEEDHVRQIAGKFDSELYHIPGHNYDEETFFNTVDLLDEYLYLWDRGSAGDAYTTWEGMKSSIRTVGNDIDVFILDNLTKLSEGMSSAERNDFIGVVISDLDKLMKDYDFEVIVLSHLNAPDKGSRQHENGGKVLTTQFTGSKALERYADFIIGFERNKQAIDPSCSYVRGLKARKYGTTDVFKTYYETSTGRLIQRAWDDEMYKDKKTA